MKSMKMIYLLFACIIFNLCVEAQTNYGPIISAMGNAGVAIQNIWSVQKNQAGIAVLKDPKIAFSFKNEFGIANYDTKSAVFAIPVKNYVLGAGIQTYGVENFIETKTSLSLAKMISPKLLFAFGFNYHQLIIENYESAKSFSIDLGLQYELFNKLWIGSHLSNPNQSNYGNNTDQIISTHIQFGACYSFSDQLLISTEIEKVIANEVDFKIGLSYQMAKIIAFRCGTSVNPFKQYGGFGLNYKKLNVDFAVSSHQILGLSPQISIGYEF
jgi:hypothetical protein